MKRIIGCIAVVVILLSFGLASANDGVLKAAATEKGIQANYYVWLPLVPRQSSYKWDAVLVLSNFNGFAINVNIDATTFTKSRRIFNEPLGAYEKVAYGLDYFGYNGDVLVDMYCSSNDVFAALALLMDINTGEVQASLPWFSNL